MLVVGGRIRGLHPQARVQEGSCRNLFSEIVVRVGAQTLEGLLRRLHRRVLEDAPRVRGLTN